MPGRHSEHMPNLANINGKLHRLTVFRITKRGKDGLPEKCVMLPRDDTSIEVTSDMEFMTAYVPKVMYDRPRKYGEK